MDSLQIALYTTAVRTVRTCEAGVGASELHMSNGGWSPVREALTVRSNTARRTDMTRKD